MSQFKPYPAYKDSGVEWLGEVPEHWDVQPLKRAIARIESGTSVNAADFPAEPGSLGVLKTSCVYTGKFDWTENKTVDDEDLSRVSCPLQKNTLIVSRMNTPDLVGATGLVTEAPDGIFLPDRLWQIYFEKNQCPEFLAYFTKSQEYRDQVKIACSGTSSSMQNLGQDDFRCLLFAEPPEFEQTQIARFLDHETARIDALIEEQQRLIELLKEKRQSVISHAVTKGLDPTVPMKDSGVEWLGEVPAHWVVQPLMSLTAPGRAIMYGIVLPGDNVEIGIPIVKGGDVKPGRLELDRLCRTTKEIEAPFARARLRPKDIVYSIRGTIGDAELVPSELHNANITQDVARISPKDRVDSGWLLYVMKSNPVFSQLEQRSLGAAVRGINICDLKRARVPVPPESEQPEIAKFLGLKVLKLNELIAEAGSGIEFLKERRSALISAAVTGKIDLRDWQPPASTAAPLREQETV